MIRLNLLPISEKKSLGLEQTQRWVNFYGSSCLLFLGGFACFLIFVWSLILVQLKGSNLDVQSNQASVQGRTVAEQQDSIRQVNRELERLNAIQKNHKYYSKFLIFLGQAVPTGLRLEGLSVGQGGKVSLSGFASQREALILFKERLEKSDFCKDVESPLANLTKQTDINFNLQFSLKQEMLK